MKRIILVNNNMKLGGVQRSLHSLLWELQGQYDVTLLLFSKTGAYLSQLPPQVKVLSCGRLFETLGRQQGEYRKNQLGYWLRGLLAGMTRLLGRRAVLRLMLLVQPPVPGEYDCAISFLHNGRKKAFYGGVNEFVLKKITARRKITFLHCDYVACGGNNRDNNRLYPQFDRIAACSEGCRQTFLQIMPELEDRCFRVRNCIPYNEILMLAEREPVEYDPAYGNVVAVARLGREKGIDRALNAVAYAAGKGVPVRFYIVGDGAMRSALLRQAQELGLMERVFFLGAQENPYRHMKNADLLLISSYHEAAPLVIGEAECLGLPVLSVKTTSSDEMITARNVGWVCGNDQTGLNESLLRLTQAPGVLREKRQQLMGRKLDNEEALREFAAVLEG